MRILHIISSSGMYGAEAVILNLSRTLNEQGHQSMLGVFLNSTDPNLQLHESATSEGIESYSIPCNGQIDRTTLTGIRELTKRTRADVVHAHGYKADIYVYLALRGTKKPLVSTCHTWYDNNMMLTLYGKADRLVLRSYAQVVAVSDEVVQRLLQSGVRKDKVHSIRNGIDLRPFDRAKAGLRGDFDGLIVGLVGRLSVEKGIDLFLKAAALVLKQVPTARFLVAGEGPDRADLERLIVELGIKDHAVLLGRQENMPSVYASLDVMVSASRQEGLPIAILEGMASKRAIVATAVGEVPTLIQDDQTGLLVQAGDVEGLASAMVKLLQDPTQRDRLGIAARDLVEAEFSAAHMTANYLRVYEEAVAG